MVVLDGLRSAGLGTALGLAVAIALGGSVASLLFDVSPRDPVLLAAAAAIMMVVGLAASAWPAWRATKIPPGEALRAD
jgi:ABC-type antimicrobial peptide transport system permease subunit